MTNHQDFLDNTLFRTLHHDDKFLVVQSLAGQFDKANADDLYGEYNMGLHVGDRADRVLINRARLLNALNGVADNRIWCIHWLNQIHSDKVVMADNTPFGITPPSADALISHSRGIALAIMTADCVPIVLFGNDNNSKPALACIHAGWQGLTKGVIKNAVKHLSISCPNLTNLQPTKQTPTLNAIIGSCISQHNYEISTELADTIVTTVLDNELLDMDYQSLYHTIIKAGTSDDKCYLDIVRLSELQLNYLGIAVSSHVVPCSYADGSFYSYRQQTHANKSATGRMATVVVAL